MGALHKQENIAEKRYAHDAELMFRAQARRNKLLGLWAAALLGHEDGPAYAAELVSADIVQPNSALARIRQDFDTAGLAISDDQLKDRMASMLRDVVDEMRRA